LDFFLTEASISVLLPIVAAGLIVAAFFVARIFQGQLNFLELGCVYVAIVALYTVYPLIVYLWNHHTFTLTNDFRLFALQPTPDEVGSLAWFYVAHLFGFVLAYGIVCRKKVALNVCFADKEPGYLIDALVGYLAITYSCSLSTGYMIFPPIRTSRHI
jgi:hypothetical protein